MDEITGAFVPFFFTGKGGKLMKTESKEANTTGPILEMLRAYREEGVISFHTPGHKGGKASMLKGTEESGRAFML